MLRFQPGVQVQYFTSRMTPIFEYASVWGLRARAFVNVRMIDDPANGSTTLRGYSLAVDLDVASGRHSDLKSLYGFLARYLPLEYGIVLRHDHVRIEYDLISHAPERAKQIASPPAPPA